MADREIINVGSTVDDGTGDLLRIAFQKVNDNFEQIWEKTSVNSNLNISEFTINSEGDLILTPADEVKITKSTIINSEKGNYDTTIHGDSIDNVLFVDASAGRVGILNNSPTMALDVTGSVNVSNTLTTVALNTTGHTVLGDAVDDTVTFNARVNSSIQPFGTQTLGTVTNRWDNAYLRNVDVSGTISGAIAGTLPNDINNDITTSNRLEVTDAQITELLVTGNLTVQGTTTTLETTEVLVDNAIVFEGATEDDFETTITIVDPTQDNTITFQDASGTVAFLSDVTGAAGLQSGDNVSELVNDAGYLTSYTETDPVFSASAAFGIAAGDITNWNTAFGWGDHSTAGYSTFDGQYSSLTGAPTIPADVSDLTDTTNLLAHYADSDVATYLNGNLDTSIIPDTNSTYDIGSAEYKIRHLYLSQNSLKFVDNSDPLNIVEYSLGAPGGVLTFNGEQVGGSFGLAANTGTHTFNPATETLTFLGTTGQINAGIAANNVTLELDTNLTGLTTINTHTIPGGTGTLALTSDIPTDNSTLANGAGYITGYTVTQSDVTTHQAALSVTESQISDLGSYLEPVSAPTASTGQAGDVAGLVAFDNNYIYYCTASYDGSTHIWKRTAWSGDTWPV